VNLDPSQDEQNINKGMEKKKEKSLEGQGNDYLVSYEKRRRVERLGKKFED